MREEIIDNLPVLNNESVAEQVTNAIVKLIMDGSVKVGNYLPTEEELGKRLAVGRSTVREAIKTLETRGLVKKYHGKGVMVVDECISAAAESIQTVLSLKKSTMADLLELRYLLEVKIAGCAAERATEEQIADLKNNLNEMKMSSYDMESFAKADYTFHKSIADASGNNVFALLMETLKALVYSQIVYTLNPNFNPESSIDYHEKIYNAIKQRDSKKSEEAMRLHLSATGEIINNIEKQS